MPHVWCSQHSWQWFLRGFPRGNHQGEKGSQGSSPALVGELLVFILMGSNTLVLLFGNWSLNATPGFSCFLPPFLRVFPCCYVFPAFPSQPFPSEASISQALLVPEQLRKKIPSLQPCSSCRAVSLLMGSLELGIQHCDLTACDFEI